MCSSKNVTVIDLQLKQAKMTGILQKITVTSSGGNMKLASYILILRKPKNDCKREEFFYITSFFGDLWGSFDIEYYIFESQARPLPVYNKHNNDFLPTTYYTIFLLFSSAANLTAQHLWVLACFPTSILYSARCF